MDFLEKGALNALMEPLGKAAAEPKAAYDAIMKAFSERETTRSVRWKALFDHGM